MRPLIRRHAIAWSLVALAATTCALASAVPALAQSDSHELVPRESHGQSAVSDRGPGRTSALSWVRLPGAEACVAAPALASAVEARLGRRVFVSPSDAEISVEGTVAYRADTRRYRATFRVTDREGKVLGVREVDQQVGRCDELDERLAFVLSILIDPDAALGGTRDGADADGGAKAELTQASSSTTDAAAPSASPPPEAAPPAVAPAGPWRWLVGAEFGGAAGIVPDVGWVIHGQLLVTPPRRAGSAWPGGGPPAVLLRGSSFLPTTRRIEGVALTQIGLVSGELALCPLEVRRPPFAVHGCAGSFLGSLSARGAGFPDARGTSSWIGGIVVDAMAELDFTPWLALTLSPSLLVPLSRARLAYDDASGVRRTIFELSPVGGSLSLGLAVGSR